MSFMHVTGRLGSDAELRHTQTTPVLSFSIADNIGFGENKKVQWVKCALFGKRAEKLAPHLKKGTLVEVVGNPSINTYDGKTGPKSELQIRVIEVTLHGKSNTDPGPVADRGRATAPTDLDDEVPF